jgi:hypothetical protein
MNDVRRSNLVQFRDFDYQGELSQFISTLRASAVISIETLYLSETVNFRVWYWTV